MRFGPVTPTMAACVGALGFLGILGWAWQERRKPDLRAWLTAVLTQLGWR